MATTAAILEYIVTANTAQANAALAKTQGQLTTMGKTSKATGAKVAAGFAVVGVAAAASAAALFKVGEEFDKAFDKIETRTGATGKELKKLEGSFKKVVTTVPTDFDSAAEAVAGLNARLGQTGKPLTQLARQITALSKITGEDVGENVEAVTRLFGDWGVATKNQTETLDGLFRVSQKTGASVSDLARNMVQFGAPLRNLGFSIAESAALFGEFEKTGVNITTVLSGLRLSVGNFAKPSADLAKTMKDLNLSASDTPAAIVEMFKQIKTLGSESEATALAIDAFGKRAGPDLVDTIRGGKFELGELIQTFKDGDGTIRQTERRTRDFAEQWQLFVNNLKTAVEPLARDVFEGLSKMMKEVQRAFKEGGLEGILDLLVQKLSDAIPKIGAAGVKIAEALVKGFLDAGVWGHVALGAIVWKLLGGVKALTATAAAGATLGTRLAIGFKAGLARTGIGLGIVALFEALTTEGGIIDSIEGKGNSIGAHFVDGIEAGIGGQLEKAVNRKSIPLLQKHVDHVNALIKVYEDAGDEVPADLRKLANAGEQQLDKLNASTAKAKEGIHKLRVGFHADLGSIQKETDRNMSLIRNSMDVNSKKGKAAIERNFSAAVTAIERAMDQGLIAEREGYIAIADMMRDKLGAYGIKGADAERIILSTETDPNRHGHHGFQTGGVFSVPGYGTGDKVPAMLEPGEVVVNRKAVAAMGGADKVNRINQEIPRFSRGGVASSGGGGGQGGGAGGGGGGTVNFASGLVQALGPYTVPPITHDDNHDGTNSHLHLSGDSVTWAKSLAAAIGPLGWRASESPWAGGVTVNHSDQGHYTGTAFDANSGDESRAAVAKVARILGGSGAAVAGGAGGSVPSNAEINLPRWEGKTRVGLHAAAALNVIAKVNEDRGNKELRRRMAVDDGNQGSVAPTGGGSSSGGFLQLPATVNVTHQTSGLPGYPAEDIFASPGTRVGAPVAGKIARLSGQAGGPGGGGAYGYSIYQDGGGRSYFMTHFGRVDVGTGQRVARGDVLGTVADYPGSVADHIHEGVSGMLRGGIIQKFATGGVPDALKKYDKTYPGAIYPSSAWSNLTQLPDNVISAMAEWAGDKIGKDVPGVTMMKVQRGEGVNRPGSRSSDGGWGLWAITEGYNDAVVQPFGGYPGMLNPINNAQVMAKIFNPATAFGPIWHGWEAARGDLTHHYDGKLLESSGGSGGNGSGTEEEERESKYTVLTATELPDSIAKTRGMLQRVLKLLTVVTNKVDREVLKKNRTILSKHLHKLLVIQQRKRFRKKALKIAAMGKWPDLLAAKANAVVYAEDVLSGVETMGDFATDPIGSMGKGLQDILDAQMLHRSAIIRASGVEQDRRLAFSENLRVELGKEPKQRDRSKIKTWRAALAELDTFRSEYLTEDLTNLQGLVGHTTLYPSPWDAVKNPPFGDLRGAILSTQSQMRELGADTTGTTENDAARVELLEGLLRDANLRTAVSQAQYDVFKNFAGGFAEGGFIPTGKWGVVGESGPEVVGGPMAVSPMGGTTVIINGDIVNTPAGKQPVEVQGAKAIVQQGSRGMGRRPLGSARGY